MMALLIVVGLVVVGLATMLGVTPVQTVFERMMVLLGADTTTFAKTAGTENKLMLISQPFTPGQGLTIGALTEATFAGYAARSIAADAQPQSLDPATGDSLLTFAPLTDPYLWETTSGVGLPQTIYGYAIVDSTKATLYAAQLLDQGPVLLTAVNQSITVALPQMRQLNGSVV